MYVTAVRCNAYVEILNNGGPRQLGQKNSKIQNDGPSMLQDFHTIKVAILPFPWTFVDFQAFVFRLEVYLVVQGYVL